MKTSKIKLTKTNVFISFLVILFLGTLLFMQRCFKYAAEEFIIYALLFDILALYIGITIFTKGKEEAKETVAIILMIIPIIISFAFSFEVNRYDDNGVKMEKGLRLYPSLMSSIFGIALITPLLIRNASQELFNKVSTYIIIAVDVMFVATFLNILVDPIPFKFSFFRKTYTLPFSCQTFVIFAIVFSWIGVRQLAGFIWAGIFILGAMRMTSIDDKMGFIGSIYVITAFLSFIVQWKVMDFNISLTQFKQDYLAPSAQRMFDDVKASGKAISDLKDNTIETLNAKGLLQKHQNLEAEKKQITDKQ